MKQPGHREGHARGGAETVAHAGRRALVKLTRKRTRARQNRDEKGAREYAHERANVWVCRVVRRLRPSFLLFLLLFFNYFQNILIRYTASGLFRPKFDSIKWCAVGRGGSGLLLCEVRRTKVLQSAHCRRSHVPPQLSPPAAAVGERCPTPRRRSSAAVVSVDENRHSANLSTRGLYVVVRCRYLLPLHHERAQQRCGTHAPVYYSTRALMCERNSGSACQRKLRGALTGSLRHFDAPALSKGLQRERVVPTPPATGRRHGKYAGGQAARKATCQPSLRIHAPFCVTWLGMHIYLCEARSSTKTKQRRCLSGTSWH